MKNGPVFKLDHFYRRSSYDRNYRGKMSGETLLPLYKIPGEILWSKYKL